VAEVVIVAAVWALMTWPWELKRRRQLSMATAGETHAVEIAAVANAGAGL
jgi:hypothetical protein